MCNYDTIKHSYTMENVMKRDMDTIRAILLKIEATEDPNESVDFTGVNCTKAQLNSYFSLLGQAGLISLEAIDPVRETWTINGGSLTWDGHEFVGLLHNDTLWTKAKESISSNLGNIALSLLKEKLLEIARGMIGL